MKKYLALLLALVLVFALCACGSKEAAPAADGSAEAAARLVEDLGGQVVRMLFVMELAGLKGRERLKDYEVESLIIYPGN